MSDVALRGYRQWKLYIEPERLQMRRQVRQWLRRCDPASKVLDVGGGTSILEPVVRAEIPDALYVSGDIAPTNATTVVLDATALPMASGSLDAILALEVLEHMPNPQLMLHEASRALRPGGLLIVTVPFMFGVHDFRDYYRYTPLGFSEMLLKAELTLLDTHLRGGTFVASSGLVRNLLLNTIVGDPKDWRAQGKSKQLLWLISTVILTPWTLVTWCAYALDGVLDRQSKSPPGYFFLCQRG